MASLVIVQIKQITSLIMRRSFGPSKAKHCSLARRRPQTEAEKPGRHRHKETGLMINADGKAETEEAR